MRKFKLIKKFPKSPEIGTVVSKWRFSDPHPELYADEKNIFFFKAEDIENYPEFWEEIKELLFTTYDGVEIFEQVRLWTVIKDSLSLVTSTPTELCRQYIYFAEKENAEKYIRDKEKKYSLNDIKEAVNKLGCFGTTLIEYLEKE